MHFEIALIGLAVHILFWDKLPNWGTWFTSLVAAMPRSLQTLYGQWRCSYCAGFWIALALHAITGIWTVPELAQIPANLGYLTVPVAWFLDALASALLIFAGAKALSVLSRSEFKVRMVAESPSQTQAADVPAKLVA